MLVDLMSKIPAHLRYLKRVEATCAGNDNFDGLTHNECKFGEWYYSEGAAQAESFSPDARTIWDEIGRTHQSFHEKSLRALHQCQSQNDDSAHKLIVTEMLSSSLLLIQSILNLDTLTKDNTA